MFQEITWKFVNVNLWIQVRKETVSMAFLWIKNWINELKNTNWINDDLVQYYFDIFLIKDSIHTSISMFLLQQAGRSSLPEMFCKFGKYTGKHLCQSLFFNKVAESLQLY